MVTEGKVWGCFNTSLCPFKVNPLAKILAGPLKGCTWAPVEVKWLPVEVIAATVAVSALPVEVSGCPVAVKGVILS